MCSREEVLKIVSESEGRILGKMHEELNRLRDENSKVMSETEKSHMAVSQTISGFGESLNKATEKIDSFLERFGTRVGDLEIWKAVHTSESRVIEEKIDIIQTNLSRIMWMVLTGVVVAILGLVLK